MGKAYVLTKSSLLSYRQCPKKLYLETYRPELIEDDSGREGVFAQGNHVGEVARTLYGEGSLLLLKGGAAAAVRLTKKLLRENQRAPIYEAAFLHNKVLIRADVVQHSSNGLRLLEIKSSTDSKDVHIEDCAIQASVIEGAGHKLRSVHLAYINRDFTYPGNGQYRGLLVEKAINRAIKPFKREFPRWVRGAKKVLAGNEPKIQVGDQCHTPYECPFAGYCAPVATEYPITILPWISKQQSEALTRAGYADVREIPAGVLQNPTHERVRRVTVAQKPELLAGAAKSLIKLAYPRYYLDFETIAFAVPIWVGTRPYQQLPFQWSCHIERRDGSVDHRHFLDVSGVAPMGSCMEQLIATLGTKGAILVYSGFEQRTLSEMAQLIPARRKAINAIRARLVDLLPLARRHYYHPAMRGSWSIKAVLPTIAPHLDYANLGEVQDGGGAQAAFVEAIDPATTGRRRLALTADMLRYCERDTLAMMEVVAFLMRTSRKLGIRSTDDEALK